MFKLNKDSNLKGYTFEYIIRILLRRKNKNNFIFQTNRFSSLNELMKKYRLKITPTMIKIIEFIESKWNKCDLIEFKLNNTENRIIQNIIIYDVKTQNYNAKRNYLDFCKSNYDFFNKMKTKFNIIGKIIKITLFENWKFNF